jgi:Asp-tRNA(Asn)/Glu-tRNA(Gln) amidotransferase C subunit
LSSIISWMDQIHDVEVADLTPFDHHVDVRTASGKPYSLEMHSFEESSDLSPSVGAEKILANCPKTEMNFIIAPKVQVEDS